MYLTIRYFMDCKIFQFGSVQAEKSSLAAILIQGHQSALARISGCALKLMSESDGNITVCRVLVGIILDLYRDRLAFCGWTCRLDKGQSDGDAVEDVISKGLVGL